MLCCRCIVQESTTDATVLLPEAVLAAVVEEDVVVHLVGGQLLAVAAAPTHRTFRVHASQTFSVLLLSAAQYVRSCPCNCVVCTQSIVTV